MQNITRTLSTHLTITITLYGSYRDINMILDSIDNYTVEKDYFRVGPGGSLLGVTVKITEKDFVRVVDMCDENHVLYHGINATGTHHFYTSNFGWYNPGEPKPEYIVNTRRIKRW